MKRLINELKELDREAMLLASITAVLVWDQDTCMPVAALSGRAEQIAYMEQKGHEKNSNPKIGEILEALGSTPENPGGDSEIPEMDRAYLKVMRKKYDESCKIPASLILEQAKSASIALAAWVEAKDNNNFGLFKPHLEKMININRELAGILAPGKNVYDALLENYDTGMNRKKMNEIFAVMKPELLSLLDTIRGKPLIDDSCLRRYCPEPVQHKFVKYIIEHFSYGMDEGRIDHSTHPLTNRLGPRDVRITVNYDEYFYIASFFSAIHEVGHALYELGVDPGPEYRGTSLASTSSLGIHESQSRFWEKRVAHSREFWYNHYPMLKQIYGSVLENIGMEDFYRAINKVEPTSIRIESDEIAYNLHVLIRFELEDALLSRDLPVSDLPWVWNKKMSDLLSVVPLTDSQGCLQDIHWAMGYFGYFPGYVLGNLYSAHIWDSMVKDGSDPALLIEKNRLSVILEWVRKHIHRWGSAYSSTELLKMFSGGELDPSIYLSYLQKKYSELYRL